MNNTTTPRNNSLEKKWSLRLIQFSAIFGFLGTYLGSHMAGQMDYALRPIHAHILLVGWLSVFAWGVFYRLYTVKYKKLVTIHGFLAMIGAVGLTAGMWFYNLNPFNMNDTFVLVFFIVGGTLLLLAFLLFAVMTFLTEKD
ncbi:hypothetical protein H1Q58_03240 [Planococcus maritimus]|uniref:Cytochrome-c oxidase n=1 Tax=Planococcus maritimus TaxID=192421 RepID=A0A7D7MD94_PLAMR|nr:hypothetical protein [Planococcus maritimus]OED31758.1 hypothetical protein BHE17_04605 [Planococcus maritimus]QMT18049.1 hypothetical protein H1Q58_03240 [Planococcus maritimus]